MDEASFEEYEEWNLALPRIPTRSTLFSLEPIGVETPWVESLTSYITRLADAHCLYVGVLLDQVIVPLVPGYSPLDRQHGLFRADGDRSGLVNATGQRALYAVQALEILTQRTDLRHLTLLLFADVLYIRGLTRLTKAWCPVCYEEWLTTGQVIYDPLLWSFLEVTVCVRHQQVLRTKCPNVTCLKQQPALGWRSRLGYCAFCYEWLGSSREQAETSNVLFDETERMWQRWITEKLGEVLAVAPMVSSPPERQHVTESIVHIVDQVAGKKNIAAFADALSISKNMVAHWYRGGRLPQIGILLRLCYLLGLSLADFLFQDVRTLAPKLQSGLLVKPFVPRKKRANYIEFVYRSLEEALASEEYPPLPLAEIARRLGYHQVELYKIHQAACYKISARYLAYLQQRKAVRIQNFRDEVTPIALQLQAQGIPLTKKHIALQMAQPGILRDPKMRELLREICQELETGDGEKVE